MIEPQLESIKIRYGIKVSKNYNSREMSVEECYIVPHISEFDRQAFIIEKANEFEKIILDEIGEDPEEKTVAPPPKDKPKTKEEKEQWMKCPCGRKSYIPSKYKYCALCSQEARSK